MGLGEKDLGAGVVVVVAGSNATVSDARKARLFQAGPASSPAPKTQHTNRSF
jgi:hypothetical protein